MNSIFGELARCSHTIHDGARTEHLTFKNEPPMIRRVGFREVVVLSGEGVTSRQGESLLDLTSSFFWGTRGFAGTFSLPETPDYIVPDEHRPVRVVFELGSPHVIATPVAVAGSVNRPVILGVEMTATAVSQQSDLLDLENNEEVLTWPVGISRLMRPPVGIGTEDPLPLPGPYIFATKPDTLFFVSLRFRATDMTGAAVARLRFFWQVRGTMRYITKRSRP